MHFDPATDPGKTPCFAGLFGSSTKNLFLNEPSDYRPSFGSPLSNMSSDEDEMPLAVLKKASAKRKVVDSDDDDDFEAKPPPPRSSSKPKKR